MRDLGVTFDQFLNFDDHITAIILIIIYFKHSAHSCCHMYIMVIKCISKEQCILDHYNVPYNKKIKNRCKVSYGNDSKSEISCSRTASVFE